MQNTNFRTRMLRSPRRIIMTFLTQGCQLFVRALPLLSSSILMYATEIDTQLERHYISSLSRITGSIKSSSHSTSGDSFLSTSGVPPLPFLLEVDYSREAPPFVDWSSNIPGSILRRLADETTTVPSVSGWVAVTSSMVPLC